MEQNIRDLIENFIKSAEGQGAKVEVHVLKAGKEKKPAGYIHFDFEDEDAECCVKNIDVERILIAVHQLLKILVEIKGISFDEAVALVKKSKERFDRDYYSCEEDKDAN